MFETFEMADLHVGIKDALRMRAIGLDTIKHLVLRQVQQRPPKLNVIIDPYLPKAQVGITSTANYMAFTRGPAA